MYVCGALGSVDPSKVRNLLQSSPRPVHRVFARPDGTVWATRGLHRWSAENGSTGWMYASSVWLSGEKPKSWRDASELGASGVAFDEDALLVHNDFLGLGELYVREQMGALYFSTTIDPLTRLGGPLTIDWDAWACVFALGSPLGSSTPFLEIRRVPACTAYSLANGRLRKHSFVPAVLDATAVPRDVPVAHVVDLLRRSMPVASPLHPIHLTLSGGADSRFLGALASQSRRRWTTAWTTSPDDGYDADVKLAPAVAAALGLRHRYVDPSKSSWASDAAETRALVQYQTWMHPWLLPLARRLRGRRGVVVDGLGGDVLFKGLFVDAKLISLGRGGFRDLWARLGGSRLANQRLLRDGLSEEWADRSWCAFDRETSKFKGHHNELSASVLFTRTVRAIAPSPIHIFGTYNDVSTPFMSRPIIEAGLTLPIGTKLSGGFYRQLTARAGGQHLASLPSTNDGIVFERSVPRRQTSSAAIAALRALISSSEVSQRLVGPALRDALESPSPSATFDRSSALLSTLLALGTFADWVRAYEDVLRE